MRKLTMQEHSGGERMCSEVNECMEMLNKIRLLGKKQTKCHALAMAEFFVLVEIEGISKERKECGITGSELAERMEQTISSVSKMVKNLEEKEYVMRSPSPKDRRVYYISVTEKGREIMKQVREKQEKVFQYIWKQMGESDMQEFNRLLKKWYSILKKGMEET